jgi:hypothetical protein
MGIDFRAGERIKVEQSLKFSMEETQQIWKNSGLEEVKRWSALHDSYSESNAMCLYLLFVPDHTMMGHMRFLGSYRRMIRACLVRAYLDADLMISLASLPIWVWGFLNSGTGWCDARASIYICTFSQMALGLLSREVLTDRAISYLRGCRIKSHWLICFKKASL